MKFIRRFDSMPLLSYITFHRDTSIEHVRMKFISMTRTSYEGRLPLAAQG